MRLAPRSSPLRGFSLTECLMVLAVLALLLGQAVPGMNELLQAQRIKAQAQTLRSDIQWARSEALLRRTTVRMRFGAAQAGSCYVIYVGPRDQCECDAKGASLCRAGAQALKTYWVAASDRTQWQANVRSLSFEPRQGLVTPAGHIDVHQAGRAQGLRHVINISGRIRTCTTEASPTLGRRCV